MPLVIEVPEVGEIEFPDGMSDDDVSSAIQKNYPNLGKPYARTPAGVRRGEAPPEAPERDTYRPATPGGADRAPQPVVRGNIPLDKRPLVRLKNGDIATVRSAGYEIDGKHILLPTISDDGVELSDQEAVDQYKRTGKHLGIFESDQDADHYGQQLHEAQALLYKDQIARANEAQDDRPRTPGGVQAGRTPDDELKALRDRYNIAVSLTPDPAKKARLDQEFKRDANRLGVDPSTPEPPKPEPAKSAFSFGNVFAGISRQAGSEVKGASEFLEKPLLSLTPEQIVKMNPVLALLPDETAKGFAEGAANVVNALSAPGPAMRIGAASAIAPGVAGPIIVGTLAGLTAKSVGGKYGEASVAADLGQEREVAKLTGEALLEATMAVAPLPHMARRPAPPIIADVEAAEAAKRPPPGRPSRFASKADIQAENELIRRHVDYVNRQNTGAPGEMRAEMQPDGSVHIIRDNKAFVVPRDQVLRSAEAKGSERIKWEREQKAKAEAPPEAPPAEAKAPEEKPPEPKKEQDLTPWNENKEAQAEVNALGKRRLKIDAEIDDLKKLPNNPATRGFIQAAEAKKRAIDDELFDRFRATDWTPVAYHFSDAITSGEYVWDSAKKSLVKVEKPPDQKSQKVNVPGETEPGVVTQPEAPKKLTKEEIDARHEANDKAYESGAITAEEYVKERHQIARDAMVPEPPKWQRPKPISPKERRELEQRAEDAIVNGDQIKRGRLEVTLDRIKKDHQAVRNALGAAQTTGDKLRAEIEMVELENELRRLAGEQEVEDRAPITEEDRAISQAYFKRRAKEVEGKIARNEPLTDQDEQDWLTAGRKAEDLPPRMTDVVADNANKAGSPLTAAAVTNLPKVPEPPASGLPPDLDAAYQVFKNEGHVSAALLQRRLKLGWAEANRILDELEKRNLVSPKPADGSGRTLLDLPKEEPPEPPKPKEPWQMSGREFRETHPGALNVPKGILTLKPEQMTPEILGQFPISELVKSATVMRSRKSGTKAEIIADIVRKWNLRVRLSTATEEELLLLKNAELKEMMQQAGGMWMGANKAGMVKQLLGWREKARAEGKAAIAESNHYQHVKRAFDQGLPVSKEVLAEHPWIEGEGRVALEKWVETKTQWKAGDPHPERFGPAMRQAAEELLAGQAPKLVLDALRRMFPEAKTTAELQLKLQEHLEGLEFGWTVKYRRKGTEEWRYAHGGVNGTKAEAIAYVKWAKEHDTTTPVDAGEKEYEIYHQEREPEKDFRKSTPPTPPTPPRPKVDPALEAELAKIYAELGELIGPDLNKEITDPAKLKRIQELHERAIEINDQIAEAAEEDPEVTAADAREQARLAAQAKAEEVKKKFQEEQRPPGTRKTSKLLEDIEEEIDVLAAKKRELLGIKERTPEIFQQIRDIEDQQATLDDRFDAEYDKLNGPPTTEEPPRRPADAPVPKLTKDQTGRHEVKVRVEDGTAKLHVYPVEGGWQASFEYELRKPLKRRNNEGIPNTMLNVPISKTPEEAIKWGMDRLRKQARYGVRILEKGQTKTEKGLKEIRPDLFIDPSVKITFQNGSPIVGHYHEWNITLDAGPGGQVKGYRGARSDSKSDKGDWEYLEDGRYFNTPEEVADRIDQLEAEGKLEPAEWYKRKAKPEAAAKPGSPMGPLPPETPADLPNAEQAAAMTWYHGSRSPDITPDTISSTFTKIESLFGSGFYLTDNPEIAKTYTAKGKGEAPTVYAVRVKPRNVLNFDLPLPPEATEAIKAALYPEVRAGAAEVLDNPDATGAEKWKAISEATADHSQSAMIPSSEFAEMFMGIESNLREKGYDAITHIGGLRAGGGKTLHRVLILLDPQGEFAPSNAPQPRTVTAIGPAGTKLKVEAKPADTKAADKIEEKIQDAVDETAKVEGQRPAKEVKTELVQKLEEALAAAPEAKEFTSVYPNKEPGKITIDIPGDGKFTLTNTKEAIGEVLKRAKRIATNKIQATSDPLAKEQGQRSRGRSGGPFDDPTIESATKDLETFEKIIAKQGYADDARVGFADDHYFPDQSGMTVATWRSFLRGRLDDVHTRGGIDAERKYVQKRLAEIEEGLNDPERAEEHAALRAEQQQRLQDLNLIERLKYREATGREPKAAQKGVLQGNLYHGSFETDLTDLQPSKTGDFGSGFYVTTSEQSAAKFADSTAFDTTPEQRAERGTGKVYQIQLAEPPQKPFLSDDTPLTPEEIKFWEGTEEGLETGIKTHADLMDAKSGRNLGVFDKTDHALNSEDWDNFATQFGYDALVSGDEVLLKSKPEVIAKGEQGSLLYKRGEGGEAGKKRTIFDMDDAELADLLEERFGERSAAPEVPGQFGRRRGQYQFPDYDPFKKWMDERYAEGDVEGMKLAFAEADTKTKVRYIKEANRGTDPFLKDWVSHLATGSPLPAGKQPVPRTTPRPLPGGGFAQPPGAAPGPRPGPQPRPGPTGGGQRPPPGGGTGGGRRPPGGGPYQQPPPPPPRQPTPLKRFDSMALVQLLRKFGQFPRVNRLLRTALGRMVQGPNVTELMDRLFWDTQLAEEVLGHEVGHFIDLAIQQKGAGIFARRLDPLNLLRSALKDKQLRQEALSLSRAWRGPFSPGDQYRNSPEELFADTMSALFNKPEWVNQNFPLIHDTFEQLKQGKPEFAAAYDEITQWLSGRTMAEEFLKQAGEAVEKTQEKLMEERARAPKMGWRDELAINFMTMWRRAGQKEGNVTDIGKTLMDNLEYSKSAAAKWDALFADDFKQLVVPELEKVDADPMKARKYFHAYSQALRTIRERRASGQWIEQNPVEARKVLEEILKVDSRLHSKFAGDLASASDPELYDLSARIFRQVHENRNVDHIAAEIDKLNLDLDGEAALMAFNVRGKLLNPGGLTPDRARQVIQTIKSKLTVDQFKALDEAGKNLRALVAETVAKAYQEGLISKKTWDELIQPNLLNSYLPYAVLDYFEGKMRPGIVQQSGTSKDIIDVITSSQLKVGALNVWRQKQLQPVLVRQMYANGGMPLGLGKRLQRANDIYRIRRENPTDEVSRGVIWQDGKPRLIEFPGDPGKTLEKAMENAGMANYFSDTMGTMSGLTHAVMSTYTTFSLPFLLFRNPVRGVRTATIRTGAIPLGKVMAKEWAHNEAWRMALNYANAAFGGKLDPDVRALIEKEGLNPPRLSATMLRNVDHLNELVASHFVLATQVRNLRPGAEPAWWKSGQIPREGIKAMEKVFAVYEAFEKIYNYQAALARGLSESKALAIMRRSGIPKPGVGGHLTNWGEVYFPWARIHIQGIRASLQTLRDPELGKGFAARFVMTEAVPRALKVALASGLITGGLVWALHKDEDKDDPVMAEVFRRVSPHKLLLDDVVPIQFYDPRTGKYHRFKEFKSGSSVPKHYEVQSLRIPSSEEGRLWGSGFYNLLAHMPGTAELAGKPGENMLTAMAKWIASSLMPQVSPAIKTAKNTWEMMAEGENPDDPFRGQPSANKMLFDAGWGGGRGQAIAGYLLNQFGGIGQLGATIASLTGMLDQRALHPMNQRLQGDVTPWQEKIPVLNSMLSYDNYGQYRIDQNEKLVEQEIRTRGKLLMSESVGRMHDFYYRNLNRQEKLDPTDTIRFGVASDFVNHIWGKAGKEGSFYQRAAHVVGPDSSSQAREAFKRDLDSASAADLSVFENADAIAAENTAANIKEQAAMEAYEKAKAAKKK